MDQNVEDKKLEDCFTRPGFVALWTKLPVKLLSLNVVAEMLAVTRMSCEDRAGETDLKAYCILWEDGDFRPFLRALPSMCALIASGHKPQVSVSSHMLLTREPPCLTPPSCVPVSGVEGGAHGVGAHGAVPQR